MQPADGVRQGHGAEDGELSGWADTVPRTGVKIFIAGDNEFHLAEDMMADVAEHIEEQDMYIENICNFLRQDN